jgi:hypothetical protein
VALEGFIVAWDLAFHQQRFEAWKSKKQFDATASISNAKKEHATVVQMWGLISNAHVHPTSVHSWPDVHLVEDKVKFQFFGLLTLGKEDLRKGEIYLSIMMAYVCLQLTELVFHAYARELETIEKIPNTDNTVRLHISPLHRPFVEELTKVFQEMASKGST